MKPTNYGENCCQMVFKLSLCAGAKFFFNFFKYWVYSMIQKGQGTDVVKNGHLWFKKAFGDLFSGGGWGVTS